MCRSFLTPYVDEEGKPKYYGRCNLGVVTLNLPNAALAANKDLDAFWKILEERAELCHKALMTRWKRIADAPSDISPIHWQHGGLCRLEKGEKIGKVIFNGYTTISLGYAGLWEAVRALIDKKLIEPEGHDLGIAIMKKLNEFTAKWKAEEHLDYSIYGSPIETMTYKFAKCNQKEYGVIEDVTDKGYVSNSYH